MLDSFELEINRYLRAGRPLDEVARSLRELWERGGLSHYDQNVIAMFLARSGQIEHLFYLAQISIEKETRVPWLPILEAFRIDKSDVKKVTIDAILLGCGVENRLSEIAMATAGDQLDPRFKKLRQVAWAEHNERAQKDLNLGLEKLEELRKDRLFEAEENLLDRLYLRFPTQPQLLNLFNQLQSRRARDVLEKRHRDAKHSRLIDELINPLADEILDPIDQEWADNLVQLAQDHPHMAYDLTIALIQMSLSRLAQKALQFAPVSRERDSLILDLLIETRQFLDALEFSDRFEEMYQSNTESAFSAMYARARALWGLGSKEDAIQMLEGLLKLRPTYRSAQAMLMEWKGTRI